jgi:thiaminase (transcriptional activator TenA)
MAEKFSTQLRRRGERIWRAIEGHAFLRELQAGTLPMDRFTYFILQDYVYLLDFGQVLCQGGAKSPDLETLELFARHALGAVEVERSFHTSFGRTLGLTRGQLDAVPKGPITQAYISHLQSVARSGTLGELVAAVLPCYWIYDGASTEIAPASRKFIGSGSRPMHLNRFGSRCGSRFS